MKAKRKIEIENLANWSSEQLQLVLPVLVKHTINMPVSKLFTQVIPVLKRHDLFIRWLQRALPYLATQHQADAYFLEKLLNTLPICDQLVVLHKTAKQLPPHIIIELSFIFLYGWTDQFLHLVTYSPPTSHNLKLLEKGFDLILKNIHYNNYLTSSERVQLWLQLFKIIQLLAIYLVHHDSSPKTLIMNFLIKFFILTVKNSMTSLMRGNFEMVDHILHFLKWLKRHKQPIQRMQRLIPKVLRLCNVSEHEFILLIKAHTSFLKYLFYLKNIPLAGINFLLQKKYLKYWNNSSFLFSVLNNLHNISLSFLSEIESKQLTKRLKKLWDIYKDKLANNYKWLFALMSRVLQIYPSIFKKTDLLYFLDIGLLTYRNMYHRANIDPVAETKLDTAFLLSLIKLAAEIYAVDKLSFYNLLQIMHQFILTKDEVNTFFQSPAFKRAHISNKAAISLFVKALRYFYDDSQIVKILIQNNKLTDDVLFYLKNLNLNHDSIQLVEAYKRFKFVANEKLCPSQDYFKQYFLEHTISSKPVDILINPEEGTIQIPNNHTSLLELPNNFNNILNISNSKKLKIWVSGQWVKKITNDLIDPTTEKLRYKLSFHLSVDSFNVLSPEFQEVFINLAQYRLQNKTLNSDIAYQPFKSNWLSATEANLYAPLEILNIVFHHNEIVWPISHRQMRDPMKVIVIESIEGLFSNKLYNILDHYLTNKPIKDYHYSIFLNKQRFLYYFKLWVDFIEQVVDFIMKFYLPNFLKINKLSGFALCEMSVQQHMVKPDDFSLNNWMAVLDQHYLIYRFFYKSLKFKNINNYNELLNILNQFIYVFSMNK